MRYSILFFLMNIPFILKPIYSIQDMINGSNGAPSLPSAILAGSTTWDFSGYISLGSIEGIENISKVSGVTASKNVLTINLSGTSISQIPCLAASVPHSPVLGTFSGFTGLQTLILSNNYNLKKINISPNVGAGVPSSVTTLDLSYTGLISLPDFSSLTNLKKLVLSGDRFLQKLSLDTVSSGLTQLYMNYMGLSVVPHVGRFSSLQVLDIGGNNFGGNISFGVNGISSTLKELYLASTGITSLSTIWCLHPSILPNLEVLDVSTNPQQNDLANNYFGGGFGIVGSFPSIKKLFLGYTDLEQMPNLASFPNLEVLNLVNNRIGYVNGKMNLFSAGTSPKLKELYIRNNRITEMPQLYSYPSLTILDIGGNLLGYFNGKVDLMGAGVPSSLTTLVLDSNSLTSIPVVDFLTNLVSFDVSANKISLLPRSDTFFPRSLEQIFLQDNLIDFHPNPSLFTPFSFLPNLKLVNLSNNALTDLPYALFRARTGYNPSTGPGNSLQTIYLQNNNGLTLSAGFTFYSGMFSEIKSGATIYVDKGTSLGTTSGKRSAGIGTGVTVIEV